MTRQVDNPSVLTGHRQGCLIRLAEWRAGAALLPAGKRQTGLQESLEQRVLPLFAGRVLPFDLTCTPASAALLAKARVAGLAAGLERATANGLIATIAAANGLTVATRDTDPFEAADVAVINPWQA